MKFPSTAGEALACSPKFENPDFRVRASKVRALKVRQRGFTLIELVVVISMILILLAIALPMYNQSIVRAREAKLHQNLTTLNKVIQEYSLDKKKAPQSLEDLVPSYLKYIPEDITGKSDTWVTEAEDPENAWDANQAGIASVHSGSNEPSSDGTPYSSWTH